MASLLNKLISQVSQKSSWDSIFLKNLEQKYFGTGVEKEPYSKSELVYICISTTSRAIGQVPIKIMQFSENRNPKSKYEYDLKGMKYFKRQENSLPLRLKESDELEPAALDNPYQELLDKPNIYTNGQLFKEMLVGFILLDGNTWIYPYPYMQNQGIPPVALWVLKKSQMTPKKVEKTGQLDYWSYNPNGGTGSSGMPIKYNEVMHVKLWNPYDMIMGLAPLEAGKVAMRTDFKASNYNEKFFDEGAVPEGVLSTTQRLGGTQFDRAKLQFEERHKGSRKVALLEQGLTWNATGLSQKDMQFIDLRKYDRDTLMQIFGMKKAIISVTEDLNYATSREQRKEWWQDTNIPIMKLIASALNFGLLWETPYIARWDISGVEALHEDYNAKVTTGKTLWEMGFTANEINDRLEFGFKPKDWRNAAYAPLNLVPVNSSPDEVIEEPVVTPDNEEQIYLPKNNQRILLTDGIKDRRKRDLNLRNIKIWEKNTKQVIPLEKEFRSKTNKAFFEMRKKSLALLFKGVKSADDLNDANFDSIKNKLSKDTKETYKKSVNSGAVNLISEIDSDIDWDMDYPEVIRFLKHKEVLIKDCIDTVKKRIENQLSLGVKEGETIEELAQRVKDVFNSVSSAGSIRIARTEVIGAMNFGRDEAMKESEFPNKQWFTSLDERTRESHADAHGQTVGMDESFEVGGEELEYPGDQSGSPENVINCRCIHIPTDEEKTR